MLTVKNKRTGVVGVYPKRQAEWLVSTGRCELVTDKPAQKAEKNKSEQKPTKKVSAQKAGSAASEGDGDSQDSEQLSSETKSDPEQ